MTDTSGTAAEEDAAIGWHAEVEKLEHERARAYAMGGEARIQRQHDRGKLTARERIDELFDPGTFEEIGILADHRGAPGSPLEGVYAAADGVVCGAGEIDGRPAYAFAEDFTVLGGSTGRTGIEKRNRLKEMAGRERLPLIYLLDGAGARGQEQILGGWASGQHFLVQSRMAGQVPQIAAVLGGLGGDPALEVPLCDFKLITKGRGMLATGGPPLVKAALGIDIDKEELGGYKVAAQISGVVDNIAIDDHDAIAQIRRYLSYMPQSCWETPPVRDTGDDPFRVDESLIDVVPRHRQQPYDMNKIIDAVVDRDSFFEIQPKFGRALIVGFSRIEGHVVGIVANQPKIRAGAFSGAEADKATHFISVCNSYNIPMTFLTDVPGFMVGPAAEREAILRRGLRVAWVLAHNRVPIVSVVIRKAYGMGAVAMAGPESGQTATLVWPSAEFGALPLEGGVNAAYKSSIDGAVDPEAERALHQGDHLESAGPLTDARVFNFDELIDPRETRPRIVRALRRTRARTAQAVGPWTHTGIFP
jgi:acetyl-CoA carboxylase carboxyltransferase component